MNLAATITAAGDNTYVTIQDTTTDWEVGAIQDVYDNGAATLNITILGVAYDAIDVSSYFNGGLQSGLAFVITGNDLKISGDALGGSTIPDGDWDVTYYAEHTIGGAVSDSVLVSEWLYGVVAKGVYEEVAVTNLNDWEFDNTLHQALLVAAWYVYLESIARAEVEQELTDFRTGLENLEIMLNNRNY